MPLIPDESVTSIRFGEALMCFVFMFPYAFFDVAGEADIERVRSACNDINPEVSLTHSAMLLEIKATAGLSTTLRFGRDDDFGVV